ncbi:MAG TPA: hypothetical protein ENJ02_00545 [Chloroflexi bacterium]|nr:hypothetical protein [Chloroflexota bacterium]
MYIHILNRSRPQSAPLRAQYCVSFWCRLRGLMFRPSLAPDEGLLLVQERQSRMDAAIHMLGMRFDLTVVWIDEARRVVDVQIARRWPPFYFPRQAARYVLETGVHHRADFQPGDQLYFEGVPDE